MSAVHLGGKQIARIIQRTLLGKFRIGHHDIVAIIIVNLDILCVLLGKEAHISVVIHEKPTRYIERA